MSRPTDDAKRLFHDADAAMAADETLRMLEGSLEAITFHNEENGFTIARLRTFDRATVTILGSMLNPTLGESLQLWGRWETHRQYGPQFRIDRYQVHRPATARAIERYLGSGLIKGIGPQTAKLLVDYFGLETLDVIEHHPSRLTEVPGIGRHKAALIEEGWREQHEVRDIMLFLQGHGISATYATKIYRTYGDRAIEMVTSNPYRLAQDVFGIGFKMADRIAQQLGFSPDMPERIQAGVLFALQQAGDQGHCFLTEEELAHTTLQLLTPAAEDEQAEAAGGPTLEAVQEAIERLVHARLLIRDTEDERAPIYLKPVFLMERALASNLRQLLDEPLAAAWLPREVTGYVGRICRKLGVSLVEQQRQAVEQALSNRLLILTGGPGTGKTTTTRAILHAFLGCQRQVLMASPTGRAAKRLSEVTGYPAQTIHRLLEVDPTTFKFKRDPSNPLECDVLVIDEMSMVDLHLAYSLVRALPAGAQLVLVGDADQLPSVGAGNVLRDLIICGEMPVVRLTEIFRQAAESTIITNAHRVNRGEMPELVPTSQWQTADCLFIAQDDPLAAAQKVCDVVTRSLPTLGYPPDVVQVLTPMQRGTLGAQYLNGLLQEALNPRQLGVAEFTRGQKTLRCGDRVIQTVNNYQKEVFNGDIGYITQIDLEEKLLLVTFPDREVDYGFDETDELQLAYALTVHKSQGSEYPAVVVALHTQHYLLLQRNLLYTALTRASKLALLLGSKRAVGIAVRSQNRLERNTRLAERLRAEIATGGVAMLESEE
jgi:exodeoxyribonuclease V alpha subunit